MNRHFEPRCYNCRLYSPSKEICCNTGFKRIGAARACDNFVMDVKYNCVICGRIVPTDEATCDYCAGRKVYKECMN